MTTTKKCEVKMLKSGPVNGVWYPAGQIVETAYTRDVENKHADDQLTVLRQYDEEVAAPVVEVAPGQLTGLVSLEPAEAAEAPAAPPVEAPVAEVAPKAAKRR
ncbi:hypothetical protein IHN63_00520 [Deinococcus sp. 6YEL10]|uniref:hypothetical protein n=1 Tax=Deinococcus sp. 6YEL10 TaxID=2745870 RepID=UPI001E323628|nr:hypothetical protein [Deinococcus sp. 6YEL10]MCD0159783.1 hypothetical protein [Deinococcus sp. 6YEL10]